MGGAMRCPGCHAAVGGERSTSSALPVARNVKAPASATRALVLGILASIGIFPFILGPLAIWSGTRAQHQLRLAPPGVPGSTRAMVGMLLGGFAMVVVTLLMVIAFLWLRGGESGAALSSF